MLCCTQPASPTNYRIKPPMHADTDKYDSHMVNSMGKICINNKAVALSKHLIFFLHDPLPNLHSRQAWHHDQQQFILWQCNVCSQQSNKQLHLRVELPRRQLAAASGIETYVNHETNTTIYLAWTGVLKFDADQRCTHYISKRDGLTQHQRAPRVNGAGENT